MSEVSILSAAKGNAPVNIPNLIRKLGIKYYQRPMPKYRSGYIERDLDGQFSIAVNSNEGVQRRRFTGAHELGHFFLHRDLLQPGGRHMDRLYDRVSNIQGTGNSINDRHERQANQFAAELLMPRSLVTLEFSLRDRNHRDVADYFEVSANAMAWRLYNLGLVETKQEVGLQ